MSKTQRFKKGDIVIITKDDATGANVKKGDEVEILSSDFIFGEDYDVFDHKRDTSWFIENKYLEKRRCRLNRKGRHGKKV